MGIYNGGYVYVYSEYTVHTRMYDLVMYATMTRALVLWRTRPREYTPNICMLKLKTVQCDLKSGLALDIRDTINIRGLSVHACRLSKDLSYGF